MKRGEQGREEEEGGERNGGTFLRRCDMETVWGRGRGGQAHVPQLQEAELAGWREVSALHQITHISTEPGGSLPIVSGCFPRENYLLGVALEGNPGWHIYCVAQPLHALQDRYGCSPKQNSKPQAFVFNSIARVIKHELCRQQTELCQNVTLDPPARWLRLTTIPFPACIRLHKDWGDQ